MPNIAIVMATLALTTLPAVSAIYEPFGSSSGSIFRPGFANDPALAIFADPRPPECPPCFNCNLADFQCHQYANCTTSSGRCACPHGWGGDDCTSPLCGSLTNKDRPLRTGKKCKCDDGWGGINCNICSRDDVCKPLVPGDDEYGESGPICYTGGLVVRENFQQCKVTNKQILDQLKGQIPEVTFSCNKEDGTCNFQFWVDEKESFYCALDGCESNLKRGETQNVTTYECPNIKCHCVPGRMLCGENGSIDLGDFLSDTIRGPAYFKTTVTEGASAKDHSEFSEPNMDQLISDVFGDEKIYLECRAGECIRESELPGYERPIKVINTPLIAAIIAGCSLFIVAVVLLVWWFSTRRPSWGPIHLSDDEEDEHTRLIMDHKPASLAFRNVSYGLKGKPILHEVQGVVHPGELMAIMGASGAGKTTFLDILARKNKRGLAQGEFFINGEKVADDDFKKIIGFVDQDDTLLPTLTVHETIVDSAMLRLPKEMSTSAKLQRVDDVERQLGIHHIRHQVIGSEEGNGRGISGGEKRRVGIACELVTSPSILFLDEPTSGLDAYNAFNVVECLVNLVKNYQRTVVMTIHQPRSNIVALFDQLVLLARGHVVYSGPFNTCQNYFDSVGFACPPGFNIADYLVDLTMHAGTERPMSDEEYEAMLNLEGTDDGHPTRASSTVAIKSVNSGSNLADEGSAGIMEIASGTGSIAESSSTSRPRARRKISLRQRQEARLYARHKKDTKPASTASQDETFEEAEGQRLNTLRGVPRIDITGDDDPDHTLPDSASEGVTGTNLDILIESYRDSDVFASIRDDTDRAISEANSANGNNGAAVLPNGGGESTAFKGYKKVGLFGQFKILSVRTWRNLYRNPMLMLTHYAIAIVLAVFLGFLFFSLTDDIKGFQNRLGLFFFLLALFGFSTLTSLTVFAPERLLFTRERAKGYYHPLAYFAAKVLFDIVPLRIIPPLIMGAIVYPMTGLLATWSHFCYFMLFLVLFNLAAAAICLFVGIVFKNGGVANLIGSLIMLFSLLFSGFLLNHESIPTVAVWLQVLSIFHYAFEGLIVNEVSTLRLADHKYGLDIEIPGAAILSSFGFNNNHINTDAVSLGIFCACFVVFAYAAMHLLLVEKR